MSDRGAPRSWLYEELVDHVRANRALFVIGTGVSLSVTGGAPTASWAGLIKDGLSRCQELDHSLPIIWAESRARDLDGALARSDLDELISIATLVERKLGVCGSDCPARRSGSTPRAAAMAGGTRGATSRPMPAGRPTARTGTRGGRHRWASTRLASARSGSMTWRATSSSGARTRSSATQAAPTQLPLL